MSKLVTIFKRKLLNGFLGLLKTREEFVYTENYYFSYLLYFPLYKSVL